MSDAIEMVFGYENLIAPLPFAGNAGQWLRSEGPLHARCGAMAQERCDDLIKMSTTGAFS